MKKINFLIKEICRGKSVTRSFLNYRLVHEVLRGKTIDIGGGKNADYISFMKRADDVSFETFDMKNGIATDFEKDRLPAEDGTYDTVLFLNVMEHIFNYQHIANEVVRITKPGGQLIGFVPFLMWYHPDHRDFFRYTHESLEIIFKQAGIQEITIEVIGEGPFIAAAQMLISSLPKILRPFTFSVFYFLDKVYCWFKGDKLRKYTLGYVFIIK